MKILQTESFETMLKSSLLGVTFEVLKNPNSAELLRIGKNRAAIELPPRFRAIVTPKAVYLWDASSDLHYAVITKIHQYGIPIDFDFTDARYTRIRAIFVSTATSGENYHKKDVRNSMRSRIRNHPWFKTKKIQFINIDGKIED